MKAPLKRSLHCRVADILRETIRTQHVPGDKLPSIRELTRLLAVSEMTVRPALAILEHEGLVELRHGSGCYVREREDKRHVAILVEMDLLTSSSYFHARAVKELRAYLSKRGVRSRLYIGSVLPGQEPALTCTDFSEDVEDGRVSVAAAIATASWSQLYASSTVPFVACDGAPGVTYSVDVDNDGMAAAGVRYLLAHGRTRIAMMAWHPTARAVFERTLAEAGVVYRPNWFSADFNPHEAGAGWAMFREIWVANADKPDGIVICDDVLARDARTAIAELQLRVPAALMVVTHSNKGGQNHFPFPVTRLEFDPAALAGEMGAIVVDILHGAAIPNPRRVISFTVIDPDEDGSATRANVPPERAVRSACGECVAHP